jgi:hypothetical protein
MSRPPPLGLAIPVLGGALFQNASCASHALGFMLMLGHAN